jgi:hypothetical protein
MGTIIQWNADHDLKETTVLQSTSGNKRWFISMISRVRYFLSVAGQSIIYLGNLPPHHPLGDKCQYPYTLRLKIASNDYWPVRHVVIPTREAQDTGARLELNASLGRRTTPKPDNKEPLLNPLSTTGKMGTGPTEQTQLQSQAGNPKMLLKRDVVCMRGPEPS